MHIGGDVIVTNRQIIAILDGVTAKKSEDTKAFLQTAIEEGFVVRITQDEPKSYIITHTPKGYTVYYSPISSLTLLKRSQVSPSDFDKEWQA